MLISTNNAAALAAVLIVVCLTGCASGAAGSSRATSSAAATPRWATVKVDLPVSNAYFPAGDGADMANAQCLICHSAGMVLRQPPLTQKEWVGELNKMRSAFGAPLPADQIDALAKYLYRINGDPSSGANATDAQAN